MSMYRQLWLAIIISMLLALAGSLLASMLSARSYLESQLSIKNTDNAAALALSLSQSNPDPVSVELTVSALFDSGHYELIRVVDPLANTIVERSAPLGTLEAPGWFVRLLPIRATPGQAQISKGWKQFGTVTLVSHSRFAYGALWNSVLRMALALTLACTFGGCLGALILRRLKAPLKSVIGQSSAISERRFITIAEPRVPELRQLAQAMNTMVTRLKTMFDEEANRLEEARRQAHFDPLTGLANREHFMARLRHSLETEDASGGILLLIRLSDLHAMNLRLGRAATDGFLKQAGEALGHFVAQNPEGVAARLNGSDFAALLPGDADGLAIAEELLAILIRVAGTYAVDQAAAWIGFADFAHGMDLATLLARTDHALASAEATQTSAVRKAEPASDEKQPRTAEQWSRMIRQALDNQWVRLISFPVVEFSGHLSHRECPLRLMFDEQDEWLPAGQFLPVAERLRLMPELDLMAVTLGLRELAAQPALPGLAINFSAASVGDETFRRQLVDLLAANRENVSRLWLEVAETGALNHLADFRALCLAIKPLGCRIGLEHFGHQLGRIGQLHDLGLDFIKVDSSFVRGIESNPGNASFLKGLSAIAHTIGLQVLGEGVTTHEEREALRSIGFDGATGPAVSEPS